MSRRLPITVEQIPGGRAFASLSRRVRTLIVTGLLFLILFALVLTLPVPYVILSPGPTYNTLGVDSAGNQIIKIQGIRTATTTGHLNMTTVGVDPGPITAFRAVVGWLAHDQIVVPRSAVYPPGQSEQQTNQQNTAQFVQSQDDAIAAADCELGYPRKFGVLGVVSDGPSHGVLEPADVLVSLDGQPADSAQALLSALAQHPPGSKVQVGIVRAGTPRTVTVKLGRAQQHRKGGSLGIDVGTICAAPFTVDLGLANQIGGPSAGLMFALGIMDKVGKTNLTDGRFIAGTGTIDLNGNVGPIGGIALKMIAARDKGATVFLAPAANCPDVVNATPPGLRVIKVQTLHGAVQDLLKLEKGQPVPSC